MSHARSFSRETERLVEFLRRASDRSTVECGTGAPTTVDEPSEGDGRGLPSTVVSFRKEGCAHVLMVRQFDSAFRIEVQTVPQTETQVVQAKFGHAGRIEWVWKGRSYDAESLAGALVDLWLGAGEPGTVLRFESPRAVPDE